MAVEPPGIIGKGIQIKGNLSGSGDLIIEGRVEGQIRLKDHLTIEETGVIVADIESDRLTVMGKMSGNINAGELVSITATGTIVGDIATPLIKIEDGARFKGHIEMDVPLPKEI